MICGVSKDVKREIQVTWNRNFPTMFPKFCSEDDAKMENGHLAKKKHGFWKRQRTFCSICKPYRVVGMLLVDWIFLAALGVVMAVLSLILDYGVDKLQTYHIAVMEKFNITKDETLNTVMTYTAWIIYAMVLLTFSTVSVHYLSISAIGSGIPEVKTILQGVPLEQHLSFRTLMSKMIGLMLALGSGFPIGKEGPFVHMGSIVAHQMRRLVQGIKPAYANESRGYELLAAGCASGVAATFSAPVGGVLFSIEVTTAYFAVRDYWRGFFAAACGAATFSLLRLWINPFEVTVAALFQTRFRHRSYYPEELLIFACIGVICGLAGAAFILIHRRYVLFLRRNTLMKWLFQRNWIVYPLTISLLYSTITYPRGLGQYLTGQTVFARSLRDFFANCTWHVDPTHVEACNELLVARWKIYDSVFIELAVFIVGFYFLVIVASTLPVPAGIFMPSFVIGAAMGRFIGELMALGNPDGFRNDQELFVLPGIYSVVGAVSFCGAVTHTVSVSVIAFELTGQLLHILPVMIAVLISNIVCSSFQPSFFDSIIKIKHLPYLPDIPKSTTRVHEIRVEQIMVRNVRFLTKQSTHYDLQELLSTGPKLLAYPLVNNSSSMILLGSVSRENLLRLLNRVVGDEARRAECLRRMRLRRKLSKTTKNSGTRSESLEKFTIEPCFPKNDENNEISSSEGKLQLPRSGSLNFQAVQGSELKSSSSDYDMRESEQRKWTINQLVKSHSGHDFYGTLGNVFEKITLTLRGRKRGEPEDLSQEEREIWEQEQLRKEIDYSQTTIDPAPFQLVEDTSLDKVHSIFSLLGLRRAYVTKCGVLVGVVAVKEMAAAIERIQAGTLTASTKRSEEEQGEETGTVGTVTGTMDVEDSESDTDNEDVILPRVEVKPTAIHQILEEKFAAFQASISTGTESLSERRKSYPNYPRKHFSKTSRRQPRLSEQSCDFVLKKRSCIDRTDVRRSFDRALVERFERFRKLKLLSDQQNIPIINETVPSESLSPQIMMRNKQVPAFDSQSTDTFFIRRGSFASDQQQSSGQVNCESSSKLTAVRKQLSNPANENDSVATDGISVPSIAQTWNTDLITEHSKLNDTSSLNHSNPTNNTAVSSTGTKLQYEADGHVKAAISTTHTSAQPSNVSDQSLSTDSNHSPENHPSF